MPGRINFQQPLSNNFDVCWASTKKGKPCGKPTCKSEEASGIPYCKRHLEIGDEAFIPVDHDVCPEIFGKLLIARFPIKKNYRVVYWGKLWRNNKVPKSADDHTIEFCPNEYSDQCRGTIDPTPYPGSVAQFAACNGPGECVNMAPDSRHFGNWGKKRTPCAGRVYKITKDIPKGHQIVHDYGSGWMDDRNITRLNAGTDKYPITKKKLRSKVLKKRKKVASGPMKVKRSKAAKA
jgi:hypothetical protein|eukprot:g4479.t1